MLDDDVEDKELFLFLKDKQFPMSFKTALGNLIEIILVFQDKTENVLGNCYVVKASFGSSELSDITKELELLEEIDP